VRRDAFSSATAGVLLGVAVAGAAAFLLLFSAAGHMHAPAGLYERIFLGLELLWMTVAAARIARLTGRPSTPSAEAGSGSTSASSPSASSGCSP
jgi:hypothetical protein